jgi:hypothetical protein
MAGVLGRRRGCAPGQSRRRSRRRRAVLGGDGAPRRRRVRQVSEEERGVEEEVALDTAHDLFDGMPRQAETFAARQRRRGIHFVPSPTLSNDED